MVGGQVCCGDGVILSLERLNKVISIDNDAAVATVEAGCILQQLNDAVEEKGFIVPLGN